MLDRPTILMYEVHEKFTIVYGPCYQRSRRQTFECSGPTDFATRGCQVCSSKQSRIAGIHQWICHMEAHCTSGV